MKKHASLQSKLGPPLKVALACVSLMRRVFRVGGVQLKQQLILALGCAALSALPAAAGTFTYTYDPIGQLVTARTTSPNPATYTYDNAGNRTQIATVATATVYVNSISYVHTRFNNHWQAAVPSALVATPVGGVAPYTYTWQYVSGDTGMILGGAGSSVNWTHAGDPSLDVEYDGVWRCKVTDAAGTVTYSPNIALQIILSTSD